VNADGTRAVYTTYDVASDSSVVTRVTVVDLVTGKKLGETINVAGYPANGAHFDSDGMTVIAAVFDPTQAGRTRVMRIQQIGVGGVGGKGGNGIFGNGGSGSGGAGGQGGAGDSGL
jgi:hypothetical protein